MARIFKYPLRVEQREMIQMHEGSTILSLGVENEAPVIYALVPNEKKPLEPRFIRVVTTGDEFNPAGVSFIGSVKLGGKPWFVAHVFEQRMGVVDPISPRWTDDFKEIQKELRDAD